MHRRWEQVAAEKLPSLIAGWFGDAVATASESRDDRVDFAFRSGNRLFVVGVKGTDDIATLDLAWQQVAAYRSNHDVPIVVVPFMGPRAQDWARNEGVSWADLSGNADIRAGDLRILIKGNHNEYTTPGRPSNPFTPRFSRVSRALLVDTKKWWKQHELAKATALPTGTVSKVIARLNALDLLASDEDGRIRARAPSLLLDAWAQRYRFEDNDVRRYHAIGRSGPAILKELAQKLYGTGQTWAATGLSAAWMYTQHADFRINSVYVNSFPQNPESLGLRPVDRGENVWLVLSQDPVGVLYGRQEQGIWCAHPVQVYLDLLGHPERASEAAQAMGADLRAKWMTWRA